MRLLFFFLAFFYFENIFSQNMDPEKIKEIDCHLQLNKKVEDAYFIQHLKEYPNSDYLLGMRILTAIKRSDVAEAEVLLAIYSQIINESSYMLMAKAVYEKDKGAFNASYNSFMEALVADKEDNNKWLRLELFDFFMNSIVREDLAWKYLEEALVIDASFFPALITKAYSLDQIENCSDIIELLNKVIPHYVDEDIYAYIGSAHYNCHEVNKAEYFLNKSLDIRLSSDVYELLGLIQHEYYKNYDEALKYLKLSIEIDSQDPETYNSLGWLYFDMNNLHDAELAFKRLVQLDKGQEPYNQIINFYICSEKYSKAKKALNESIDYNGKSYMTDAYDIVLHTKTEGSDDRFRDLIFEYEKKYQEFEVNWLKDLIDKICQ